MHADVSPPSPEVDDPRALLGTWVFDRVVTDHLAGETITVSGTLDLELLAGSVVRWLEHGVMRRGSALVEVSRELRVVRDGEGWAVTFADGRGFHPWQPGRRVEHLCGADTYRGLVDADEPEEGWSLTWWVSGPRKDYVMVTRLERA